MEKTATVKGVLDKRYKKKMTGTYRGYRPEAT
jgi:hypothetical protein